MNIRYSPELEAYLKREKQGDKNRADLSAAIDVKVVHKLLAVGVSARAIATHLGIELSVVRRIVRDWKRTVLPGILAGTRQS